MKKTILCIDDTASNLFTVESVIESMAKDLYEVVTAGSALDGLDVLLRRKIDIILLDVMMPEIDGFETAKMIKSNKKTKNIPIIFLTAKKDDETIENSFILGSDYVNKPFNHVELLARISLHIRLSDNELEAQRREEELTHEANFDSLTQIYNRKMFHHLMHEKFVAFKDTKETFVLVMLDIDHFKRVNDTYGHLVGDEVLKTISKEIKSHIRESDILARWGGEEFTLSFDVGVVRAMEIAENLRKFIESIEFENVGTVTCSFGLTEFIDGDTLDTLTSRADTALYEAKASGRNRVCQA